MCKGRIDVAIDLYSLCANPTDAEVGLFAVHLSHAPMRGLWARIPRRAQSRSAAVPARVARSPPVLPTSLHVHLFNPSNPPSFLSNAQKGARGGGRAAPPGPPVRARRGGLRGKAAGEHYSVAGLGQGLYSACVWELRMCRAVKVACKAQGPGRAALHPAHDRGRALLPCVRRRRWRFAPETTACGTSWAPRWPTTGAARRRWRPTKRCLGPGCSSKRSAKVQGLSCAHAVSGANHPRFLGRRCPHSCGLPRTPAFTCTSSAAPPPLPLRRWTSSPTTCAPGPTWASHMPI
jgi:hypothetical protein